MSKANVKIFLLFLSLSISVSAQWSGKIRGTVVDSSNGEPLSFANILVEKLNYGTSTNEKGYFLLSNIPAGKHYYLLVSYIGYESKRVKVYVRKKKITSVKIALKPASVWLTTIEKVGTRIEKENIADLGLERITIKDLETVPTGVESDAFRFLQYLPGVTSVGDISARYNVRGGANNQNLVLLDDVVLYNPFHAFGVFSVIDPEIISNIDFYKSGFPTEYGGRISSLMKINTKEGNKFKFGGKASLSLLTAKLFVEGPIPHGSFYISGRKNHNNFLLKKVLGDKNIPFNFYDYGFKVTYHNPNKSFIDNSKWTLQGFFSKDETKPSGNYNEQFKWGNSLLGLKRFQVYSTPLYSEFIASVSNSKGEIIPSGSRARKKANEVNDLTVKMNFHYIFDSRDELGVGVSFKAIKTTLVFVNPNGVKTNIHDFGGNVSFYLKYIFKKNKKYTLSLGSRVNLEGLKDRGNFYFEPRINLNYRLTQGLNFKAAWGMYQQGLTTITDESDVVSLFEPWFLTPGYLDPARAIHFDAGLFTDLKFLTFSLEGYYKDLHNLPEINSLKKFQTDPDLISVNGKSYGVESSLRLLLPPFRFSAAYSWGFTYKLDNGRKYYPNYDSRNNVKLSLEINLGKGWFASSVWLFHSGRPFTPTVGYYDKYYFDDPSNFGIYESYLPFLILGEKNIARLPTYHRLDLGIYKFFKIEKYKFYLSFSVMNAYNRKNIFYFERETGKRVNMLPLLPSATIKMEL